MKVSPVCVHASTTRKVDVMQELRGNSKPETTLDIAVWLESLIADYFISFSSRFSWSNRS